MQNFLRSYLLSYWTLSEVYFVYKAFRGLVTPCPHVIGYHYTDKMLVFVADNRIEYGTTAAINYSKLQ
jgi:hypothetical protein